MSRRRGAFVALLLVLALMPVGGHLGPQSPSQGIGAASHATSTSHAAKPGAGAAQPRAGAGAASEPRARAGAVAAGTRPKLLVILVVDQFRADYIEKFGASWTGGLRRLLTEGAWFREAAYPYFTTVTCAGHSTIVTGSLPATHGIISNTWWERATGQAVNCVSDPNETVVSYNGKPAIGGTSVRNLRVSTLSDELRAQMKVPPRIVTLSLKDYTATTMAGRKADAATWFNPAVGSWTTSTYFTKATVPFVADFIKAHPVEADYGKTWSKLLPEAAYLYQDDAVGEATETWGRTFPHVLESKGGRPDATFYVRWEASPFSDAYLAQMAADAVDALKLGQREGTDYLAVSFSALDIVGHEFGPRSHEVQDVLAHLDQSMGGLLAHLDRSVGKDNYVLALTADHGVSPIPEQLEAMNLPAGRIALDDLTKAANKALKDAMGGGAPQVARIVYNDLYFAPGDWPKIAAKPEAVRALIEAIRGVPGIARVLRGDQLAEASTTADDRVERAAELSYFAGRSGDLILVPRPYWLYALTATTDTGTGHGTPYDYDQRVPLILAGQGIIPGQYLTAAGPMDIAPTLAFLCGITLAAPDGRVLNEALAPMPPSRLPE